MKSIALLAVAGLATVASAQSGLNVALTFDKTSIAIGETATATVTASWTGVAGSYMSSINANFNASGEFVAASNVAAVAWNNAALGFNGQGTASGASVLGVQASQFSLIPPFTNTNPILVTTFTVTGTAEGLLSYSSSTVAGAPAPYSVTGPGFSDPVVFFGNDSFSSADLRVTPAPSAMALLGLGGLVAGRRRR